MILLLYASRGVLYAAKLSDRVLGGVHGPVDAELLVEQATSVATNAMLNTRAGGFRYRKSELLSIDRRLSRTEAKVVGLRWSGQPKRLSRAVLDMARPRKLRGFARSPVVRSIGA
jgi:hypothetical protein